MRTVNQVLTRIYSKYSISQKYLNYVHTTLHQLYCIAHQHLYSSPSIIQTQVNFSNGKVWINQAHLFITQSFVQMHTPYFNIRNLLFG